MARVLAIVPAFNERSSIADVIRRIRERAAGTDVMVVDDCSRDGTRDAALRAGATVVTLPVNLGIGGAVQTGFKHAERRGYDVAVQVDADGQHDPADIPRLIAPILAGAADVVIGSRYLEQRGYRTPIARRMGMILFSKVTSLLCGQKITDTTSGFRALGRQALAFFAAEYPVDFPDSEALIVLHRRGFRITEIPVTMYPRSDGISSTGLVKSIYYPYRSFLGIAAALLRKQK